MANLNIKVNGKSISIQGDSVQIVNGDILVNGSKLFLDDKKNNSAIEIKGDVKELSVDNCSSILVTGSVGDVKLGAGNIQVSGDVRGSINTGSGDVQCNDVQGNVNTGSGDISAYSIEGDATSMSGDIIT